MLRRSTSLPALTAEDKIEEDPVSSRTQGTRRKRSKTAYCMSYLNEQRAKTVEELEKTLLVKKKSINDLRKINKALLNNFHKKPHVIMSTLQAQLTAVHAELSNKANMASTTFINEHDKAEILKDLLATCRIERSEGFFRDISENLMDCLFKRLGKRKGPNALADNSISLQRRVIQLGREVDDLRSDVERTRRRLHDETAAYNSEVERETDQIQILSQQIPSLKLQKENLKESIAAKERDLQQTQLLKVNDDAEAQELAETSQNVLKDYEQLRDELKQKSKNLKEIKASNRRLKKEIWETKQTQAQYRKEQEEIKEMMENNTTLKQRFSLEVTRGRELINKAFSEYTTDLTSIHDDVEDYKSKNISIVCRGEPTPVEEDTTEYFPSCNDPTGSDNSLGDYMRMLFIKSFYTQIIEIASNSIDSNDLWTDVKIRLNKIVQKENEIASLKQERIMLGMTCKVGSRKKQLLEIKQKLQEIEYTLLTSLTNVVFQSDSVDTNDIGEALEELYKDFIAKLG